jgi:hypothetical protein
MKYTIYNSNTGEIVSTITVSDSAHAQANLGNSSYIEGSYSGQDYYVDQGQAMAKPHRPMGGFEHYYFDYNTKTWAVDPEISGIQVRNERNRLLADIDRVNPIWYASLTADQQHELIEYRQVLLAVPQQSGFPESVSWPVKPTWL